MQTIYLVNKHVVLVENDPGLREVLKNHLLEIGVSFVQEAANGNEALEFFDRSPHWADIVLCNRDIPGVSDGVSLFREFRTTHPQMPFIMLSERNDLDSVRQAQDIGVDGYLIMPLSASADLEKKMIAAFRKASQSNSRSPDQSWL